MPSYSSSVERHALGSETPDTISPLRTKERENLPGSAPAGLVDVPPLSPNPIPRRIPNSASHHSTLPDSDMEFLSILGESKSTEEILRKLGQIPLPSNIRSLSPVSSPRNGENDSLDSWSDLGEESKREPTGSGSHESRSFSRMLSRSQTSADSASETESMSPIKPSSVRRMPATPRRETPKNIKVRIPSDNPYLMAVTTPRPPSVRKSTRRSTRPRSRVASKREPRSAESRHDSSRSHSGRVPQGGLVIPTNVLPVETPAKLNGKLRRASTPPVEEIDDDLMTFETPISRSGSRSSERRRSPSNPPRRASRELRPLPREELRPPHREELRPPHREELRPLPRDERRVTRDRHPPNWAYTPSELRMGKVHSRHRRARPKTPTPRYSRRSSEDESDSEESETEVLDGGFTWQEVTGPNFDLSRLTSEEKYRLYEIAKAQYIVLDGTYGALYHVPEFPAGADLSLVIKLYTDAREQIYALQGLGKSRVYLMLVVAVFEIIMVRGFKFEAVRGFTMHQCQTIRQYDLTLIDMGEVFSAKFGRGWPPGIWLLISTTVNAVIFLAIKLIFNYLGDGAVGIIRMLNSFLKFGTSGPTDGQPDPYGSGSTFFGFDIPNIITAATSTVCGNGTSKSNDPPASKTRTSRGRKDPPFRP